MRELTVHWKGIPIAEMTNDAKRREMLAISREILERVETSLPEYLEQSERLAALIQSLDSELSGPQCRPLPHAWRNELRPF